MLSPGGATKENEAGCPGSKSPGSTEGDYIDWLTISDNARSVVADVMRVRKHPLVPGRIPIHGQICDEKTGKLIEINQAGEAGKTV